MVLPSLLPILVLLGFWFFIVNQMQSSGSKAMAFGKSRARLYTEEKTKVTFDDVAGADEAKDELEIVEFSSSPGMELGPKSRILLVISPGTGAWLVP